MGEQSGPGCTCRNRAPPVKRFCPLHRPELRPGRMGRQPGGPVAWSSSVPGISDARRVALNPSFSISAPFVRATGITETVSAGPKVVVLARCDQQWTLSKGRSARRPAAPLVGGRGFITLTRHRARPPCGVALSRTSVDAANPPNSGQFSHEALVAPTTLRVLGGIKGAPSRPNLVCDSIPASH